MPKIAAPTVKEHREKVLNTLIDAAEQVLREQGSTALTAEAVSSIAGLARNSIYRYVSSVDELRILILERYLPNWMQAIEAGMKTCETPGEKVAAWVRASLKQSFETGHGWFMSVMRPRKSEQPLPRIVDIHRALMTPLSQVWDEINAEDSRLGTALTINMTAVGMKGLDRGQPLEPLTSKICVAVEAVVHSFQK